MTWKIPICSSISSKILNWWKKTRVYCTTVSLKCLHRNLILPNGVSCLQKQGFRKRFVRLSNRINLELSGVLKQLTWRVFCTWRVGCKMKISHLSNIFMIYVNVKNKFLAVIILIGWLSGGIWVENNKTRLQWNVDCFNVLVPLPPNIEPFHRLAFKVSPTFPWYKPRKNYKLVYFSKTSSKRRNNSTIASASYNFTDG